MTSDNQKRYQVLQLYPQVPQGVCCTNFPDCKALLIAGSFFVAYFPEPNQAAVAAIGNLHGQICTGCQTPQATPVVFRGQAEAQGWADLMNTMGHHGQAPLIPFRPSVPALLGVAIPTRSSATEDA